MRYVPWLLFLFMFTACATSPVSFHTETKVTSETVVVYFDFDRADLRAGAKEQLQLLAEKMQHQGQWWMVVEGHTDQLGSASYNEILGEERARSVSAYLVQAGLSADHITFLSKGKSEPVVRKENTLSRHLNRRVEIRVSFLSGPAQNAPHHHHQRHRGEAWSAANSSLNQGSTPTTNRWFATPIPLLLSKSLTEYTRPPPRRESSTHDTSRGRRYRLFQMMLARESMQNIVRSDDTTDQPLWRHHDCMLSMNVPIGQIR